MQVWGASREVAGRGGQSCYYLPGPGGPRGPGECPWSRLASPGTNTCFPCQPRAAGTRGSGPRPRAVAAAAPNSLMANAELVRTSSGCGLAQQSAPQRERSKSRRQSVPGEHFRGEGQENSREKGRSFRTSEQSSALRCPGALSRLGRESAVTLRF